MNEMPVICWLLLVHLLVDWCWQGDFIANNKGKSSVIMFVHCATWALALCAVLSWVQLFAWWKLAFLLFGHWPMDLFKCKFVAWVDSVKLAEEHLRTMSLEDFKKSVNRSKRTALVVDQVYHVVQIIICLVF